MKSPVQRLLALVAASVAVLLALVGALPGTADARVQRSTYPPVRPTRVLVLGDSVIKGAEAAVIAALPGREVVFDAEVNRSTGTGADIVAQRGADWDVAVVLLGHNDGGSPGAFQPAARSIIDQLRDVPYVSWLTIHEVRPYYPDVNHFIAGLEGEYPNLHQGDWNAVANAHPEGVSGDGLHLNGTGANLMAGLVAEQVETGEKQFNEDLLKLAQATTTTAPPTTTTTAPPTTTSTTTSTTTTTTTTTDATTTEAAEPAPAPVVEEDDDDQILLPALGAAGFIAIAFGIILVARRRRARRDDRHTADTAG
jgi:lysophospholipase L1-like esterase